MEVISTMRGHKTIQMYLRKLPPLCNPHHDQQRGVGTPLSLLLLCNNLPSVNRNLQMRLEIAGRTPGHLMLPGFNLSSCGIWGSVTGDWSLPSVL